MPKFIITPTLPSYPVPAGADTNGQFDSLAEANAAATAALNVFPGQTRTVSQVVAVLSAAVNVSVVTAEAETPAAAATEGAAQ